MLPCRPRHFRTAVLVLFCLCPLTKIHAQGTYPKIEASFNITSLATDPFDYTATDVRVQMLRPDNSTVLLPAFFDGGTTWRVRYTPTIPGAYSIQGVTLNGAPISVANLQPASWTVAGTPTDAGFIRVDPSNPRRFVTANGKRFFPRGENVAWDSGGHNVTNIFWKMGAAHENWSRVWMNHWDGKNLDWPAYGPTLPTGQLNLAVAQKWDAIVAAAEQAGVHFQMTLQHHGQYSSTVDSNWGQNPYNTTNTVGSTNGFLTDPVQFFTNATAKALTKRKLRYAVARWGYSTSIMAWELFNEVQFTDAGQTGQWGLIQSWHNEMALFLRSQDPYQHLITTSSDLTQPIWDQCDYYTHHDYPNDVITGLRDATDITALQPVKPSFGAECATNGVPLYGVNAPLWAGLMNGQSGAEQPWWWDSMDGENDYIYFRAVSDFISRSGLGDQNVLNKSIPAVTGGANGPLAFSPGGGWATNTQDTFTVGNSAPDGIGSAPSYLQGDYHRVMTPNGYTFIVNYPQPGTFSVQIVTIASSGAGLEIFLDGTVQTNISFPATAGDTSTNFNTSIAVSAGAHSIQIYNPGLDWVNLGNITLNPYVPALSAYAVGNAGFSAIWVWNRTNVFNPGASSSTVGTVQVAGLNAGAYSGIWWDTFAGVAISNFTFSVASSNSPVTLGTPSILRSAALYVGLPPQANIFAPNLNQTLGTNSPAYSVPLTIANNGGLPLGYSLSVTNPNALAYGAISSIQPGGPFYAWKDISPLGQDLTSSFTALASPKTAKDEGIAGPVNIGFAFPFFTNSFTQLYVSPNGFVAFSPFGGDTSTNTVLPGGSASSNCIAFFWDDLDLGSSGHVYALTDPVNGTFTLQFQNVLFKSTASTVNCQLILKTTGEILMQYQSLAFSNTCTVGVQNAARTQGLTVAFNQNYLQSGFAVRLTPVSWLGLDGNAGFAPASASNVVNVSFNPAGLAYGTYSATLLVQSGDPNQPLVALPVSLAITPRATWRQTHFGTAQNSGSAADTADPDHDGIINILEYAFNTDPNIPNANPISLAVVANHLTVTFKRTHPAPSDLSYTPQVADDLTSGIWNSGPTYTSQTVTDNGDGTETVVVTDNSAIGSAPGHFLRILITPL
ncbi:MAG: DUF5060 domain-containing protein [Verrucomicrobiia bacterium]